MGQDRSGSRTRRSRAKATPHSHLLPPTYPNPATGTLWPPRGWSEAGIRNHEVRFNWVKAFLCTWGAAGVQEATSHGKMPPAEARMRELMQFARDPLAAATVLTDATTAVLDMRGFTRADTHPIPRPDLSPGTRRTAGRSGTHNGTIPAHLTGAHLTGAQRGSHSSPRPTWVAGS